MCRLQNIAMRDYQESVTTRQTGRQTDSQMPDKVIPMCRYALQATQKLSRYQQIPYHKCPLHRQIDSADAYPSKTEYATVKWSNLCLQIIQSQTCYLLKENPDKM